MGDADEKKKPFLIWEDEPSPGVEEAGKRSRQDHQLHRGRGNRSEKDPDRKLEFSSGPLLKLNTQYKKAAYDSRHDKGAEEKFFYQFLQGKAGDLELLSAQYSARELKARATLLTFKGQASAAHVEIDLVDQIKRALGMATPPHVHPPPSPPTPPAPMAARLGDVVAHGSVLAPGLGSMNVFIGGLPAWRAGIDVHMCPAPGAAPHGIGTALPGALTVFINGAPAARAGDCLIEATGGPNMILLGCTNVFIGPQAPPPAAPALPDKPPEKPSVELSAVAKADVASVEGDVQVFAEIDAKAHHAVIEAQAGAMVAAVKAEVPIKLQFALPGSEYHIGIGVTLEGSLFSAGAEVGGGAEINDSGVKGTWGAKVGAGIVGGGAKFGFECTK